MDHRNSVVIVTGASSGIGRTTAREFARRGAIVVAVARREALLRELIDECRIDSAESMYLAGDLGNRDFAESIIGKTEEHFGRLDVLINNAGMSSHKSILQLGGDEAERVLQVNFLSCVWTTLAAIPAFLRNNGGTIVNVSSFAAMVCPPREAIYAASKAAMNSFTEGLWGDLEGCDIHAAIVNPGPIDTPIWDRREGEEPAGFNGYKYPPEVVTDAIFEAIENKTREITVPRRNPSLVSARILRLFAPSLLLRGMARMEPVDDATLNAARTRAMANRRGA